SLHRAEAERYASFEPVHRAVQYPSTGVICTTNGRKKMMGTNCDPRRATFRPRVHFLAVAMVVLTVAGCGDGRGEICPEEQTATLVERLRSDPERLAELLRRMPKGADLHSHLTGAARTESLIDWGIEANLCVDEASLTASSPPCDMGTLPMRDAETDPELYA